MKRTPEAGVVIEYKMLGTMSIDEFRLALWTDLAVLKDQYGVKFVKAPRLKIPITEVYTSAGTLEPLHCACLPGSAGGRYSQKAYRRL